MVTERTGEDKQISLRTVLLVHYGTETHYDNAKEILGPRRCRPMPK